ncbi:ClpXP protease specificity-enhancing factor [Neptunomonas japonica]|uniref:Stringent starvation protein B n=1 Tax=Neptunomonas japonica JAMM 1380 TaxID=1441457 RepID=A0A7R6PAI0_9GAMM|nr:ClpXP protease specificity-enhancing factor [Neptunomonas japonica]BBB28899.1 stringent starvation protein B [Neptunomonas japonica JAMM 1380]
MKPSRPYLIKALQEWLLDNDCTPHLAVDVAVRGVMVPEQFISDGQIVLNISPSAVQNFLIDDEAISFNARFGGVPMNVYVPMAAVLAVYARENGAGMGFGMEPGADFYELEQEEELNPEPPKPSGGRPTLKVVK